MFKFKSCSVHKNFETGDYVQDSPKRVNQERGNYDKRVSANAVDFLNFFKYKLIVSLIKKLSRLSTELKVMKSIAGQAELRLVLSATQL